MKNSAKAYSKRGASFMNLLLLALVLFVSDESSWVIFPKRKAELCGKKVKF